MMDASRESALSTDVAEIDRVLRAYPWLDCELRSLRSGGLVIAAGVDLHGPRPDLLLAFDDVLFACAPTEWRTDTGEAVLSVLGGEEESKIRIDYRIGGEHTIFEMRPEDLEGRCRIAARSVRLLQHRPPEAPLRLPAAWSGKDPLVGLDRESVHDDELWKHFTEILEAPRHAR